MRNVMGLKAALLCSAVGLLGMAGTSFGQVNGLVVNQSLTGANATSTVTNNNSIPGTVTIDDGNAAGTGADRFDVLLSQDSGATAATFNPSTSFTISANITLTDNVDSPRKEAGLRINGAGANVGNDALFIIDSDAHEIVAFGGPFYSFASGPTGYQTGQTIFMEMQYDATAQTLTYLENDGSGLQSSGPLPYTPVPAFQVGLYTQWTPANSSDFDDAQFNNIHASATLVPEPASLGMLALGGLSLLARRRARTA